MDTSLTNAGLLLQAVDRKMILKAIVCEEVPGGFILRMMGFDVFLPWAEVADGTVMNPGEFVDICVIKTGDCRKLAVVSNRKAVRRLWRSEVQADIDKLHVGEVYRVMVMEFAKRGVVVSAGGILGIVPYRMLSWKYFEHPSELCSVGQEVLAVLMSKEEFEGYIRLIFSVRDMNENPWTEELCHYLGKEVEGEVVLLKKYGAFVDFDNVRGLIHKTEISWCGDSEVRDFIYMGQKVKAKVISVDIAGQAIGLSMKALTENPWDNFLPEKCIGEIMEVMVVRRRDGGLVVRTSESLRGYISEEDCAWVGAPTLVKGVGPGDILTTKVVSADVENQRLIFSVKALSNPPWLDLTMACSRKTELKAGIVSISPEHLLLEVMPGVFASLEIDRLPLPANQYRAGDFLEVMIIRISWEKPITVKVELLADPERECSMG